MRTASALVLLLVLLLSAPLAAAQGQAQNPLPVAAPEIFLRGREAVSASDFEQALLDFSLFILLNPTDPRAHYLRAISYTSLGDTEQALDDLTRALNYTQNVPELEVVIYGTRAELYRELGQIDDAIADLSEVIARSPSPEAYASRALLYLGESSFEDAVDDLDQAISLVSESQPELFFYRATAKSALDDAAAASDYLQWINGIQRRTNDEGPLEPGQSILLDLAPSLVHRIPIVADAGDTINIVGANLSGDADPLLVIVNGDGAPVAGNDAVRMGDTSAVISGFEVADEGRYNLLVTHSITGYNGRVVVLMEKQ